MELKDRILTQITLISPNDDGNQEYSAKWIGDPITKEKKLGLFDSPKIKGTAVQDLEVKSDIYQLVIFFDDSEHDLTSEAFWKSLDASGKWGITHPQRGPLQLNLMRATWENEYVRSVGYTTFRTNWIEGLPDGTEVSIDEIKGTLNFDILSAIDSAISQFISNCSLDNFEEFNALVSAVNKTVNAIKKNLRKFENLQIINPKLAALFRGIDSTISSFPPDTSALAAQFANVYEAVGLAQNSSIGAIDNYVEHEENMQGVETDGGGPSDRNAAATIELNLSLNGAEIARAVILPGITTRTQAIEAATALNDYFDTITNRLDLVQENFEDTPIEDQYVSQSDSFAMQAKANKRAIQYLISTALNLKVERRFTTKVPRMPIEIAWTELNGSGEYIEKDGMFIDQNFSDFCDWNGLHGQDIIWLPAETEVRVFV